MRLSTILSLLLFSAMAAAAPRIIVKRKTPPPFGYGVGSVIQHHIDVFAPTPWQLDKSRLPSPGPLNEWVEIRHIQWGRKHEGGGTHYHIDLSYQIFPILHQGREWELPPLILYLRSPGDSQPWSHALPSWRFTAMPMIPTELPNQQVRLHSLWHPLRRPLTPHWRHLTILAGILFMALLTLGRLRGWIPWRRRTPFAYALPHIRQALREQRQEEAFRIFHRALDQSAGYALFAGRIQGFIAAKPAFAPLEPPLRQFFTASQELFFQGESPVQVDLESLCRACLEAERRCRE